MIETIVTWGEGDVPETVEQFFEYISDADEVDERDLVPDRGYACEYVREGRTEISFGYYVPTVDEEVGIGDWDAHFNLSNWDDLPYDTSAEFIGEFADLGDEDLPEWERRIVETPEDRMKPVVEAFRDSGMFGWE